VLRCGIGRQRRQRYGPEVHQSRWAILGAVEGLFVCNSPALRFALGASGWIRPGLYTQGEVKDQLAVGLAFTRRDLLPRVLQPENIGLIEIVADGNVAVADQPKTNLGLLRHGLASPIGVSSDTVHKRGLDRVQIAQVLGIDADVGKGIIVGGGHPPSVPPDASPRVPTSHE
jgi:hypothetical protein